jgi:ABC-type sugar transport system permease subunit
MTSAVKKPAKKKRASSLERKKARAGWIFALPFLIGFIFIYLPIVFESIKSTFFIKDPIAGNTFVWFDNYKEALFSYTTSNGQTFLTMLGSALTQLIIDIPAILIFSLFMAVLLNQKMAGRAFFRAIFFIPVIIATGIMESIEAQNILSSGLEGGMNTGAGESATDGLVSIMDVEKLFANLMVGQGLAAYVTQLINNIFDIVNRSGVQMLIFLAGLQSISPAIYESCSIDGATGWETFWKITFPMISPMILVNAVYTIIDSFTTDQNTVMKFIDTVYTQASGGKEISSAMSWMYFMIVILIVAAVAGIASAFVFYQKKD